MLTRPKTHWELRCAELEAGLAKWEGNGGLLQAVRDLRGFGDDWPDHGNAPLAIAASYALLVNEVQALTEERDQLRAALESMTHQFAYPALRNDRAVLTTGGLSALEDAFDVLGWEHPHALASPEGHQQDDDQKHEDALTRADTTGSHADSRTAATDPKGSA